MARSALVTLALALCALVTAPAVAQTSSDYLTHLGRGLTAASAGDRAAARSAFRQAVQLDGARPEARCHLAAIERLDGDLPAALEAFQACLTAARAANDPRWTARALHGVASTLERSADRLSEARAAWQEYVRFSDGAAAIAPPAVGRARMAAIDAIVELDRTSAEVRQRIAERAATR